MQQTAFREKSAADGFPAAADKSDTDFQYD